MLVWGPATDPDGCRCASLQSLRLGDDRTVFGARPSANPTLKTEEEDEGDKHADQVKRVQVKCPFLEATHCTIVRYKLRNSYTPSRSSGYKRAWKIIGHDDQAGIRVNNAAVEGEHRLKDGDVVCFTPNCDPFVFHSRPSSSSPIPAVRIRLGGKLTLPSPQPTTKIKLVRASEPAPARAAQPARVAQRKPETDAARRTENVEKAAKRAPTEPVESRAARGGNNNKRPPTGLRTPTKRAKTTESRPHTDEASGKASAPRPAGPGPKASAPRPGPVGRKASAPRPGPVGRKASDRRLPSATSSKTSDRRLAGTGSSKASAPRPSDAAFPAAKTPQETSGWLHYPASLVVGLVNKIKTGLTPEPSAASRRAR